MKGLIEHIISEGNLVLREIQPAEKIIAARRWPSARKTSKPCYFECLEWARRSLT